MSATALVIDDEVQIRRLLRLALESKGYKVHDAGSGQEGLSEAVFRKPDVIILDMGLPDMDGLEVLKRLREWSAVPVLILSVLNREQLKVDALELGADDYVTKPFSTAELIARLRAIQRRAPGVAESPLLGCGALVVNSASHEVTLHGQEVKLTPTEYAVLKVLATHPGRIVTHKQLLEGVWGPNGASQAHSLRVYVNLLRKKIEGGESRGENAPHIVNEPAIGYRLVVGE